MGVPGLNKFVTDNPELTREYKLCDKKIIVDGSNFVHFLYTHSKADFILGGEYKMFADCIQAYIASLQECCLEPIVVFDGGLDKSGDMFEKRKKSHKKRLERVYKFINEWEKDENEEAILPVCAYEVFKLVLLEMGIKIVQCEYKEDNAIAALANDYNCPVLSNDSDFYIFPLKNGFIRLEDLNPCVQTGVDGRKYLNCKIYYVESFKSQFDLKEINLLPLFAALLSHRSEHFNDSKSFFYSIGVRKNHERFQKLLNWLKQYPVGKALETVVKMITPKTRNSVEQFLKRNMKSYELKSTNLMHMVDGETEDIIQKSKLSTNCGAKLPGDFVLAFHKGLPSSFLTVLTQHCQFLSPLIEDFSLESSHSCTRYIRKVLRGILLQHESESSSNHNQKCLKTVDEYDRELSKDKVKMIKLKFLTKLQNGGKVPMLSDIYRMEASKLSDFIRAVLGAEEYLFEDLPSDLLLFFYCVNYWIQNCKPAKSQIISLVLCVIYHQVTRASSLRNEAEEGVMFQNVSEFDVQNLKRYYLQVPAKKPYDLKIVHSYNQLQVCVLEAVQLNWLAGFPFISPKLQEIFSGTLLYNLAKETQFSENNEGFIKHLLGNNAEIMNWFKKITDLLINILKNFA